MIDHSAMKLGRIRPPAGRKLVMLRDFLSAVPASPASTSWIEQCGIDAWGMFLNDQLGCCTRAAQAHIIMQRTTLAGAPVRPTDADVLAAYERSGYNPADPATDDGALEADVLADWQTVGMAGDKIDASASIHPQDTDLLKFGVSRLSAATIGLNLPLSAQTQEVWDMDVALGAAAVPGTWGEHEVPILDYDADGLTCITWGAAKRMTWKFLAACCDEIDVPIGRDFIGQSGETRSGLDLAGLQAARATLSAAV